MRLSRPIRWQAALLAAGCSLWVMCVFAFAAKDQTSSASQTAQTAKTQTKTKTNIGTKSGSSAVHKKSSASAAKKSTAGTASKSRTGNTTHARSAKRRRGTSRVAASKGKPHGQQKIDSERVQAIQEALIREHYLTGDATGTWSQSSEDAMRHYQADHGWQSKTVPDSRALIKLGLGPSHDHLLNPESAMTTQPDMPRATSLDPSSHSADPGITPAKVPTPDAPPASTNTPTDSANPQ